jgi:hemoglobin-like flavoprotein
MALDVALLRGSFELVVEREPQITRRFYEILFDRYPQVRPMFHRKAPEVQQKMLAEALAAVLDHLEDAAWLENTLHNLGATHVDYEVTEEMYGWVGESLLATLAEVAGDDWTPALADAWSEAYGAISGMMIEGARRGAATSAAAG